MNLEQIKCIKVNHTVGGETTTEFISWETYQQSFVKERWSGERRTGRVYTIFGMANTKTTVTSPMGTKSVRTFEFPKTRAEILALGEKDNA